MPLLIDTKTGRPVDLPDDLANRAIAAGTHRPSGPTVRIVAKDGQVFDVDAADAQAELAQYGSRLETPEEAKAAVTREELGGGLGQLAAGVSGLARGASLGLTDVVAEAAGFGELQQGLREANPATSVGTEIVGQVGGAVLGGPAKLAAGAGMAVERLAGKGLANLASKGIAGRVAARGLSMGAGGATEGALTGAGMYLTEASLGEVEPGAEALMASVGLGAILGGGMGTAMGGAFQLGAEGWGRVKNVVGRFGKTYSKGVSMATGVPEEKVLTVLEGRGKLGLAEDAPETFGSQMAGAVDQAEESSDLVNALWRGERKKGWERQVIAETDQTAPDNMSAALLGLGEGDGAEPGLLRRMQSQLEEAEKAGRGDFAGQGQIKHAKKLVQAKLAKVEEIAASGRPTAAAEMAGVMDDLKRSFGHMRNQLGRADVTPELLETLKLFDDELYAPLRQVLEDETLVGRTFATAQKEINAEFTKLLELQGSQARAGLSKMVGKRPFLTEEAITRGERVFQADPKGYENFARALGEDQNAAALSKDYVLQRIQRQDNLAQTIAKHYDLTPEMRTHVERLAAARKEIEGLVGEGEVLGAIRRGIKDLETAQTRTGFSAGLGAVAGGFAGGPVGALAGAAIGAVLSPARTVRQLATLDRLIGSWRLKVEGSVGRYIQTLGKAGRASKRAAVPAAVRAERYLGEASFESHTGRDQQAPKKGRPVADAYRARYRELSRIVQDPRHAQDQLQRSTSTMDRAAPQMADAVRVKAAQAAQYLADNAPRAFRAQPPFSRGPMPLPSSLEIASWARRVRAADKPETILEDLESGRLTREAVETMRAVHPRLYADLVAEVQDRVGELREDLPYRDRLKLTILFGVPVEPAAAPDAVASWQAAYQQAEAAGMGPMSIAGAAAGNPVTQAGLNRIKPESFATEAQRLEAKA